MNNEILSDVDPLADSSLLARPSLLAGVIQLQSYSAASSAQEQFSDKCVEWSRTFALGHLTFAPLLRI